MANDEDIADGEDVTTVEDDVVDQEDFISEEEDVDNEDVVTNEGNVADKEDAILDEGDALEIDDMEDAMVDEENEVKVEGMIIATEVADVAGGKDTTVDEGFGLMPHADGSLSPLILCQLPLRSVQL